MNAEAKETTADKVAQGLPTVWLLSIVFVAMGASWMLSEFFTAPHGPEAAVEASAEDAGHHGGGPWESSAFWAQLGTFIVLLSIVVAKAKAPLGAFLVARRKQVEVNLVEARELKAKAAALHKEYTERLARIDREIAALRQEMVKAGEAERDRIIAEAEAKAARLQRDTQFLIEQQVKQLRIDLKREATLAAIDAAEDALRAQAGEPDQKRLADEFLTRLQAGATSPVPPARAMANERGAVS